MKHFPISSVAGLNVPRGGEPLCNEPLVSISIPWNLSQDLVIAWLLNN
jgi:hypothetical protein